MVDIAILKLLSSFFVFFFPRSSAKQTLETLKFVHDMSLVSSVLFLTKGGVEIGIYQIHYQRGRRLRILNIFYDSIVNLSLESLDVFFFPMVSELRFTISTEELRWPGHPEKARFAMFKNLPADCI